MRRIALVIVACLMSTLAFAAVHFPALTGRVVDGAHILSASTQQSLTQTLADYEAQSTNQVVVATLATLDGDTIEDYGYQLGRTWGIGQKGKDNGALLIVAPNEKKVRIEVGYGLEGTLTDAIASAIIQSIILPDFKAGHMEQGVIDGTQAILSTLSGKAIAISRPSLTDTPDPVSHWLSMVFLILFFMFFIRHPFIAAFMLSNSRFGGSSFGGGDSFGGGGGGFGGGGSSGSW